MESVITGLEGAAVVVEEEEVTGLLVLLVPAAVVDDVMVLVGQIGTVYHDFNTVAAPELASLEANGVSTFKTTNLTNDGSWTDALRKKFLENTVQISVPYTAKYGVDLKDSAMRIVRKDSIVEIHLPQPRLLSYELRLDRMETTNRSGWLLSPSDERYTELQKKLYTQSRAQLEANSLYLIDSRQRICTILEQYFLTLKLKSVCIFDMPSPLSFGSGLLEAGCDEAGRGCLAGPVFAAAVILPDHFYHPQLNDSKQAMHKAVKALHTQPSLLLIDGNRFIPYRGIKHECIVKGDSLFMPIAAASILAKTHRDEYMQRLHEEYPYYKWNENKGYGTRYHRQQIVDKGTSPYHRKSFSMGTEGLLFPEHKL
ncbi:ribonuclease HII [Ostertagia ostertagi]